MDNDKPENEIEILSQPFLTEDGFINPACMNELESALKNIPRTYERLKNDTEWSIERCTSRKEIVGALAKWACRQSPYGCPDGLEIVLKYFNACLKTYFVWDTYDFAQLSLININKACWDILGDFKPFLAWNETKNGNTQEISFSSKFDGHKNPDNDFIDLDALLRNVCLDIRAERRENDAFDKKFQEKYK